MKIDQLPQVLSEAQQSLLIATTPKQYVKQRKARGNQIVDYVEVGYVIRQLNLLFGHLWDFEILEDKILGDEVIVKGKLSVKSRDSQVVITKMQYGSSEVKRLKESKQPISIGDDLKAAASDSLKKCASLVGIALDVYSGESFSNVDVNQLHDSLPGQDKAQNVNRGNSKSGNKKATNSFTTFWSKVYSCGLSKQEGLSILESVNGDPDVALSELEREKAS
jgi:hypothetical protein